VQNGLANLGVEVITDGDAAVHVSGHPRRGELEQLYRWVKPQIAIPMHGEANILRPKLDLPSGLACLRSSAPGMDSWSGLHLHPQRLSTTCRSDGSTAMAPSSPAPRTDRCGASQAELCRLGVGVAGAVG